MEFKDLNVGDLFILAGSDVEDPRTEMLTVRRKVLSQAHTDSYGTALFGVWGQLGSATISQTAKVILLL